MKYLTQAVLGSKREARMENKHATLLHRATDCAPRPTPLGVVSASVLSISLRDLQHCTTGMTMGREEREEGEYRWSWIGMRPTRT